MEHGYAGSVSVQLHLSQRDNGIEPRVAVRACPPKLFREGGTSGYPGLEIGLASNLEKVAEEKSTPTFHNPFRVVRVMRARQPRVARI